jgi:minor extracellular serine protease Vpr
VELTLTIPSTAQSVISVGGYQSNLGISSPFSGRGRNINGRSSKPDLVAPGVNILTSAVGGGYDSFTGTSVAAPFVTGSAALMMQWGIVLGNDPFLYNQRVKAFFQRGARRNLATTIYPNAIWGYGTLSLCDPMALVVEYTQGGTVS